MNRQKIYIDKVPDREAIAALLVKSGYTVRIGREKMANGKSRSFVEYWVEG